MECILKSLPIHLPLPEAPASVVFSDLTLPRPGKISVNITAIKCDLMGFHGESTVIQWDFMMLIGFYPLVNIQKAIENGRNCGFTHEKW